MIRVFKDKRSAGANGLLGEGGQDPRSEERELREGKGEKGRERPSAMHNRADVPLWGSSNDEGRRARSTHVPSPGTGKESTHWRNWLLPEHMRSIQIVGAPTT